MNRNFSVFFSASHTPLSMIIHVHRGKEKENHFHMNWRWSRVPLSMPFQNVVYYPNSLSVSLLLSFFHVIIKFPLLFPKEFLLSSIPLMHAPMFTIDLFPHFHCSTKQAIQGLVLPNRLTSTKTKEPLSTMVSDKTLMF